MAAVSPTNEVCFPPSFAGFVLYDSDEMTDRRLRKLNKHPSRLSAKVK